MYKVESTVGGKSFVTARGWDDLSQMIHLYEQHKITVDRKSAFWADDRRIRRQNYGDRVCKRCSV